MKPFIPAVRFEMADPADEAGLFYSFMEDGYWADGLAKFYPEARSIQVPGADRESCLIKYKDTFEKVRAARKDMIDIARKEFVEKWGSLRDDFLHALSAHFETEWPREKPEIIGKITVIPIYPRFLAGFSFFVGYKSAGDMIETSAHEIVHFLWFKKWREVFPDIDAKEYESPHLVWRLSEVIDPIILQCHPVISSLIKPKHWGYSSFEKVQIEGVPMVEYFKKIYLDSVAAHDSFEMTMRKLWTEAQKHERELRSF